MSTHPYIPLYVDDYEAATAHLTPEEDGIYNRLLRLAWRTPGCGLPTDPAWLARKIRVSADDFERVAQPILDEFFAVQRGRFVQRRLKREYDDITRKKSARKQAGKKGGDAKALKTKENTPSNATVLPADTRAFPKPEPEPKKETPRSPKGASVPEGLVERVWLVIPPKSRARTSRADIASAMRAAADRGRDPEAIAATLCGYYATADATKEGGQFAKTAHRLIERDRWLDLAAPTPLEALAAAPDPDAVWRRRVQAWQSGSRYWNTNDWEAPPGKPGCIVPVRILAEFNIVPPLAEAGKERAA